MLNIDLTRLPIGGTFVLNGKLHTVKRITQNAISIEVDGKTTRLNCFHRKWGQFIRDIEGLIIAAHHGVDAGCLNIYLETL